MLSWSWPAVFLLLPVPLLIRWIIPAQETTSSAVRVPFYRALNELEGRSDASTANSMLSALLLWLVWTSVVIAAARPIWVGEPVSLPQERRDLMLAVDISRSMLEQDMLVGQQYADRISAVKAVVSDFVEERSSDRLGLILFGERAYLQTPLTYDSSTVQQQLLEAQSGFAGNATAIGDTIGLAVKRLRDRPADSRVLILLTDGANSAGSDPIQAAQVATEAGIRIHTIGVGADVKYVRDFFGGTRAVGTAGELDEQTLTTIAELSGGLYFRARDPEELQKIYTELDRLEPVPEEQTFRPTKSLAYWPLLMALLMSTLLALSLRRRV